MSCCATPHRRLAALSSPRVEHRYAGLLRRAIHPAQRRSRRATSPAGAVVAARTGPGGAQAAASSARPWQRSGPGRSRRGSERRPRRCPSTIPSTQRTTTPRVSARAIRQCWAPASARRRSQDRRPRRRLVEALRTRLTSCVGGQARSAARTVSSAGRVVSRSEPHVCTIGTRRRGLEKSHVSVACECCVRDPPGRQTQLPVGREGTGSDGAARPGPQLGDVVVRGAGRLGGVRDQAEVARRGQPALVVVEHVEPGEHVAVEGVHADPDLAEQREVGGLPAVHAAGRRRR